LWQTSRESDSHLYMGCLTKGLFNHPTPIEWPRHIVAPLRRRKRHKQSAFHWRSRNVHAIGRGGAPRAVKGP
jgi:hypothetical protein